MKKDALKKHHFWIFLAAVPVLLGIVFLDLIASDNLTEFEKKYKTSMDGIQAVKPPGKSFLADQDGQKGHIAKTIDERWKANYERQKNGKVFEWPRPKAKQDPSLAALESLDFTFGFELKDVIDNSKPIEKQYALKNDEFAKFTDAKNYFEAYKDLAESVAPTMYEKGSWQNVLRFVTDWKSGRPPWEQFWLALEDYWVQKALLAPIAEVNASIAKFNIVPPPMGMPEDLLKRKFQSRVWDLDLELTTDNGVKVLKSKLKNRTERLQVLGVGKSMRLKVWFDDPKKPTEDFEYRVEGEVVKGNEEITPRYVLALHRIPAGMNPNSIVRVEQVFEPTTVPIRLVRRIELGYTDSKRVNAELKPPEFLKDEVPAAGTVPPATGGAAPPAPVPPPRGETGGVPSMPGGAPNASVRTGTYDAVLLGNKKRYLEVTDQIRRMPVGVVVVIDQAYVNDLLVAYANSPLRFLTTQVQEQRFRDSLPLTPSAAPATGAAVAPPMAGPIRGEGPGPGSISGGGGSSLSETQSTAGLTELGIYGVVTFYEKYAPKTKADPVKPGPETPTPKPVETPATKKN